MAEEYLKKHRKRLTTEAAEFFCVQNRRRFENGWPGSSGNRLSTHAGRWPIKGSVRSGRRVILVIVTRRRPVEAVVLLLAGRRPVIWLSRRRVVLNRRRCVIPILDSDRQAVAETGSGTGFVGKASRRQWDHKRWE